MYGKTILTSIAALGILAGTAGPLAATAASTSTFAIQGASITPTSPSDFGSAAMYQSLKNLKAANANQVSFVIPLLQSSVNSTDIGANSNTPTDASLITAIQEAHGLGLSVTLKPHTDVRDGQWRASIDPYDRAAWFANYATFLTHYADIAQAQGVEQIIIGTELIDLASGTHNASNTQNWYNLIAATRAVYSGKLGYAANWGPDDFTEMNQIQFWDKLDFIGVDLYYKYAGPSESVSQMQAELQAWNNSYLSPLQKKYNKPVEFTEVGYRSVAGANIDPGNYQNQGAVDLIDQAQAYQALFSYWSTVSFIKGITIWEWTSNPNGGGLSNTDFTPQGKPAEAVIAAWYAGNGTSSTIQDALTPLQASASTSASSTPTGIPLTVTVSIKNAGTYNQTNELVDTEIYDANGGKVFQQFSSGQTILAGQTASYHYSWTPTAIGTYSVKVGVFANDWSANFLWNDHATTITIANAPEQPTQPVIAGTLSAVANTVSTAVNSVASIIAHISNGGSALANVLVDTEVYDANGSKVFQNFSGTETIASGAQKDYLSSFTPKVAGLYRVALGIFAGNWSKNFLWVNQAGTITAGNENTPPVNTPPVTPPVATSTLPTSPVATSTPPVVVPPVATTTLPVVVPIPPPTPPSSPAPISGGIISGQTSARVGTSVNFGGSNFGHEESVTITVNGVAVSPSPHADGGGNFSTGSLSAPATPGTYTYVFIGNTSNIRGSTIVEVTP